MKESENESVGADETSVSWGCYSASAHVFGWVSAAQPQVE